MCVFVCVSVEGGELFSRIKAQKRLKERITKLYFFQMLKAVQVRLRLCPNHSLYVEVHLLVFYP